MFFRTNLILSTSRFSNHLPPHLPYQLFQPNTLVSLSTFLKQLIQTFHNLHFTADLHSSTVLTLAKEKLPHHLLPEWTEHTVRNHMSTPILLDFQQWLDVQAEVLETIDPTCDRSNDNERSSSTTAQKDTKSQIPCLSCLCCAPSTHPLP